MYGDYALAGKGLKTLILSEIVGLIATVLSGVALVGSLAGLAGLILGLVGLHTASPTHPYFKNAFFTSVGNIVANFLGTLLGESGFFSGILSICSGILGLLTVYYVCMAASHLLSAKGDQACADKGGTVWKLYAVCTLVSIVCAVLVLVPIINIAAALLLIIVALVMFVAGILYLVFLSQASQSLQ